MKVKLYSILDTKALVYYPPFIASNDEVARRDVRNTLKRSPGSPLAEYPSDFILYAVGEWTDSAGVIDSFSAPELVCRVDALVVQSVGGAERDLFSGSRVAPPTEGAGGAVRPV